MPRHLRLIGATLLLVASSAALAPARPVDAATKPVLAKRTILQVTPQGRITQLAIDPRNTGTLYAGTDAAGIYRSANGGATWALATQGLPAQGAIAALAVDPANSRTIYAATRVGVYKSVNGGGSWSSEGPPTAAPSTSLALDPLARDTIYAGTGGDGIYRSTNGGATWSAIGPRLATVQVLATDPISPTILYAGTDDGLLIGDAGGTWRRAGLGNVAIRALAIGRPTAADPALLYAGTSTGVLRSTDGGSSWARVGLAALAIDVLHVEAADPRTVYAGGFDGAGLYRSSDAGRHWRRLTAGLGSPNVAALAFDPGDPRVAYAGLDHGVFKTLQAGASWASSSIYDRSVYALLQAGSTGGASYAGTNGGVYTSTDGGTVWTSAGIGNHAVRAAGGAGCAAGGHRVRHLPYHRWWAQLACHPALPGLRAARAPRCRGGRADGDGDRAAAQRRRWGTLGRAVRRIRGDRRAADRSRRGDIRGRHGGRADLTRRRCHLHALQRWQSGGGPTPLPGAAARRARAALCPHRRRAYLPLRRRRQGLTGQQRGRCAG